MSKQSLENSEFNLNKLSSLPGTEPVLWSPQLQLLVSRPFSIHAAEGSNVSWPIHELRPRYNLIAQGDVSTNALL